MTDPMRRYRILEEYLWQLTTGENGLVGILQLPIFFSRPLKALGLSDRDNQANAQMEGRFFPGHLSLLYPCVKKVGLHRFWGIGKEKFGRMIPGGFYGQISTDLYKRIQAASSSTL
jgi:hypothetical protein